MKLRIVGLRVDACERANCVSPNYIVGQTIDCDIVHNFCPDPIRLSINSLVQYRFRLLRCLHQSERREYSADSKPDSLLRKIAEFPYSDR